METGNETQTETNDGTTPLLPESERDEITHNEIHGGSFTGGVFNLATTIIGAGIMALPATMKILGLLPGIAMILLMAFLTNTTIEFLLRFSTFGEKRSYAALMEESYGKTGRILLQISILVSNIGVLIVYIIIIGDVMVSILEALCGENWWSSRFFVLLITTLCVFPWTLLKRIDALRVSSYIAFGLAIAFLIITTIITIIKLCTGDYKEPKLIPNLTDFSSFMKLFTVVPVLVNAFICHCNIHTIHNELEDATQIKPVVQTAIKMCACVYIMISISGYLLFGEATLDDVLANFDTNLGICFGLVVTIKFSYAAHLVFVFPIIFYPLRVNLDGLVFPTAPPLSASESTRRFHIITVLLVVVIFVGAFFIPNIWDAFQFTGATASVCIGFIFPAAIILKDHHNQATKKDKIIAVFMIVLAVFSNGIAIYSDVIALLKTNIFT